MDANQLAMLIDAVPHEIIARFKVVAAFRGAPRFAKNILKIALPDSHPEAQREVPMRSDEEKIKALRKKKGIPNEVCTDPLATVLQNMATAVLGKDLALFSFNPTLAATSKVKCHANVFLVDKSTRHETLPEFIKRIIVDARFANELVQNQAEMKLFSLDMLRDRVARCFSQSASVSAISCDLRHWFHQIPLPDRLKPFFRINLFDRSGKNGLYPNAYPMGFQDSPGIGQAFSWSIVLHGLENAPADQLAALGLEELRFMGAIDEYVIWLPLSNGGAVFVLVDGILVIHPSQKIVENWRKRIAKKCDELHAILKDDRDKTATAQDEAAGSKTPSTYDLIQQVQLKRHEENPSIKFAGVRISGAGFKVAKEMEQEPLLENQQWEGGTFRDLARLMSTMLWHHRVHNRSLLELRDFMDVYSQAHPGGTNINDWNNQATLSQHHYETLKKSYKLCQKNICTPYKPTTTISKTVHGATDASSWAHGWCYKIEGDSTLYKTGPIRHNLAKLIHLAELKTVRMMIEEIDARCEHNNVSKPDLFVIAVDSKVAIGMILRGYAKKQHYRDELIALFSVLDGRRLSLDYVDTTLNPGDAPSRGDPFEQKKWDQLLVILKRQEEKVKSDYHIDHRQISSTARPAGMIAAMKQETELPNRRQRE